MAGGPAGGLIVSPGVAQQVAQYTEGAGIINIGVVPVFLSSTDPAQTSPFALPPGGSLSWIGTLYVSVSGKINGNLYVLPGLTAFNSNLFAPQLPSDNFISANPVSSGTVASGANTAFPVLTPTNPLTVFSWFYVSNSITTPPTKGEVIFQIEGTNVANGNAFDVLSYAERTSIKLQGLVAIGADIQNNTDQSIQAFINLT